MADIPKPLGDPGSGTVPLRDVWPPLLILLYSGVTLALVLLGTTAAVRAVPVLTYIAVVPGLACVRLIRLPDRLTVFLLGVGLSLALGIVVAQTMIYLRQWSPLLGIATLEAVAAVAAMTELLRGRLTPLPRRSSRRRST